MSPHTATVLAPTSARVHSHAHAQARPSAPVLIRVPTLSSRARKPARPAVGRVRRRLRSEVRVASLTLLVAMPMSWALFTFAQIGPARASEPMPATTSTVQPPASPTDDAPVATIGLMVSEPAPSPAVMDADAPTLAPSGRLLPHDGPEEMVHEGP